MNLQKILITIIILLYSPFVLGQKKIRVACIGDSVTFGYGLVDPKQQSYPSQLQQMLGDIYEVGNFGYSGATLLSKGHKPYINTDEYKKAIDFNADVAIIHLGLNDTDPRNFPNFRNDFIPDYNRLIENFKSTNPKMRIIICKMSPIFTGHPRFASSTFDWYHQIQQKITQVAEINGLQLIDFYENMHNRPDLITDDPTLHPNELGAKFLAKLVYEGITGDFGGLQMPSFFASGMILQREKPIVIWGKANANSIVEVTLNKQVKKTKTLLNGKWSIEFSAQKASSVPVVLKVKNEKKQLVFDDILVGDLWLAAGQSNMSMSLKEATGGLSLIKKNPNLRLLKYTPTVETYEQIWDNSTLEKINNLEYFNINWQKDLPEEAANFSAIAYAFGAKIQKETNVPIGIVQVAVGGSPLISWISRKSLEQDPLFRMAFKNWRSNDFIFSWCRERANFNLKNSKSKFQRHPFEPSYNFESAIDGLEKFPIKGLIWYQGESDAENPELYKKLFPILVADWRNHWNDNFPIYYAQLSSLNRPSWGYFRNSQRELLSEIENVGMVVTSDLGEYSEVHFKNKIPVGVRLADMALNKTYSLKSFSSSGPLFESCTEDENGFTLKFTNAASLKSSDGKEIRGFKVMDDKGNLKETTVSIIGNRVYISKPSGFKIIEISYCLDSFCNGNLINEKELPTASFIYQLHTTL